MTAAAKQHGNRIDIDPIRPQLAQHALVALREVHPNMNPGDIRHHIDHSARNGEIVRVILFFLLLRGVNISYVVGRETNFQCELCPQTNLFVIHGVKVIIQFVGVKGLLSQKRGQTEGTCVDRVVPKTPGIRDHAGKNGLGRQRRQLPAGLHRHGGDQPAAAFKTAVHHFGLRDGFTKKVMVDARRGCGCRIAFIADKRFGGCVEHDCQRVRIDLVGHLVHDAVFHKSVTPGRVAHRIDRFARIIVQNQVF